MTDSACGPEKNDGGARQPDVAKIDDSTLEKSNKQESKVYYGSESGSLTSAIATPEQSGREQEAEVPMLATTVPLPLSPQSTPLDQSDSLTNSSSPSSIVSASSPIPMPVLVTGQSAVRPLPSALTPSPLSSPAARVKPSLTPRRPVGWKSTLVSVSNTEPRTHPSGPPSLYRSFTDAEVSPSQPLSPVPTDSSPRPPGTISEASALGNKHANPAASVSPGSVSSLGRTARPVNTSRGVRGLEGLGRGVPTNRRTTPRRVSSAAPLVIGGRRISSAMQYAFKAGLSDTESDQQVGRPAAGTFLKDVPPLVSDTSSDEAEARGHAAAGGSNGMTAQGGAPGVGDGERGGGERGGRIDAGDDIGSVGENQISQTIGPILETGLDDHVEANDDHADVPTLLAASIPACPTPDQGNEADDEGDGDVGRGDQSEAADHSSDSEDTGVSQHHEPPTIRSPASPVPHERSTNPHYAVDEDSDVYRDGEDGDSDQDGDQEAVDISNLSLAHSLTDQDQDEVWMSYVRNQLSALFPDFFDPSSLTTSTTSAIPATRLPTPMTGSFDPPRQHHSEHDDADTTVMGLYGHGAYHGSAAETVPNVRMEIGSLREEIERLRGVVSGLADNMSLVDITPKMPGDRTSIEGRVQDLSAEDAEGDISLVEPGPDDESIHPEAGERDETGRTGIEPDEVVEREETQLPEAFLKTAEQSYRLIKHLHQTLGSTSSGTQTIINSAPATDEDIFASQNLQDLEAKLSLWTTRPHVKQVEE